MFVCTHGKVKIFGMRVGHKRFSCVIRQNLPPQPAINREHHAAAKDVVNFFFLNMVIQTVKVIPSSNLRPRMRPWRWGDSPE